MEIQTPRSVQINFQNKIITLHNVTIVKNPRIVTIDASNYANFLKGSPVKVSNASTATTPLKIQMPSLAQVKKSPQAITFKTSPTMPNQTPVIRHVPSLMQQQVIRSVHSVNGVMQFKPSPVCVVSSAGHSFQSSIQSLPVRQQQQTVIISPPKATLNQQVKFQVKPQSAPTYAIAKSATTPTIVKAKPVIMNTPTMIHSTPAVIKPNPTIISPQLTPTIISPKAAKTIVSSQWTPMIVSSKAAPTIVSPQAAPTIVSPQAAPTKVIISPPQKNKISPCVLSSPKAKRPCKKLEFHCIFCKDVFDDSSDLVDHMRVRHPELVRDPSEATTEANHEPMEVGQELKLEPKVEISMNVDVLPSAPLPASQACAKKSSSEGDLRDDEDESEVKNLIMDFEETQDTAASSQDRSETPDSPEFEEHVPIVKIEPSEDYREGLEDLEYEEYEYSSIMEPICELSCEDASDDGYQDENEAMRLYREAMEVNYQQNGIKKRGRRKPRKVKPLVENMTSINGILAGLLENVAIKVPPGPGRGRRKEMNEEELELDRSNGVCLFSCNKCDESFKYAGDLAKHVRSHTISSPYQCSICQRKFTHIGSLNTHLRIHSGERPYKCNQCEKSFTQSNSLMVHVKSHLSNKPFQCPQCNKGFLNASSLALHTKTHTGPTMVACPIDSCGKEFRDNNLLEEHLMTHRQSMLYQCSLCSEKFEQSCLLVQHVKSHIGEKPFQCNQCGKCFTQPGSLNTHLRIHTGEKPFECVQCGKKFTQASSLSVHMKVHGEKEFKCVIESCKKSYSQEAYLKKHMLKHLEATLNDENNHFAQE